MATIWLRFLGEGGSITKGYDFFYFQGSILLLEVRPTQSGYDIQGEGSALLATIWLRYIRGGGVYTFFWLRSFWTTPKGRK